MNKATIAVVVLAGGLLGYLAWNKSKATSEAHAKPETVEGYLPDPLQGDWQKRKDNPILFLNEKEEDRKKQFGDAPYDEIELTRKGATVTLKKEGADEWKMTAPVTSEVESYRIKQMIEAFATDTALTPAREVKDKALLTDFGLDPAHAVTVTLKQGGQTKVALVIGDKKKIETEGDDRRGGPETYDTFVMLAGKDTQIYRARQKDLRGPFELEVGELRSKKVFSFDKTDIAKITVEDPNAKEPTPKKLVLAATWEEPPAPADPNAKEPADPTKKDEKKPEAKGTFTLAEPAVPGFKLGDAGTYWSTVSSLRAMDFMMGEKPPAEAGLTADKAAKVTIELKKAGEKPIVLLIGEVKDKDRSVYAQIEGKDEYLTIADSMKKQLIKTISELRDKAVLGIEKEESVTKIEITNQHAKEAPIVFAKVGDTWEQQGPTPAKPSQKEVTGLVSALKTFRVTDYLEPAPTPEESGLGTPTMKVVATVDGKVLTILFGSEKDSKAYATVEGSGIVFTLGSWTKGKFDKKPEDFKNKTMVDVDPGKVKHMELVHTSEGKEEKVVLDRGADNKWAMAAPKILTGDSGLNEPAVNGIATNLKGLEVKGFTTKTLAEAGLDKPVFTLTATLEDGSTRVIKVSDLKDGDAHFVSFVGPGVDGGEQAVFTMDAWKLQNLRKKAADLEAGDGGGGAKKGPPGGHGH